MSNLTIFIIASDARLALARSGSAIIKYSNYPNAAKGKESAAVLADFIVVDMFGEACTGRYSPKDAVQRAERRARRHYRG
jgi:multiple sugar transport system substrate-binding protein